MSNLPKTDEFINKSKEVATATLSAVGEQINKIPHDAPQRTTNFISRNPSVAVGGVGALLVGSYLVKQSGSVLKWAAIGGGLVVACIRKRLSSQRKIGF